VKVRRLTEIEGTADHVWFQPALDRFHSLDTDPDERARGFFARDAPVRIARAPGRLDVFGGIADYSGALVLQLPLACATFATVQHQAAPRLDVITRRDGAWQTSGIAFAQLTDGLPDPASLRAWVAESSPDAWPAYPLGVVWYCLRRLARGQGAIGLRLLLDSSVPEGSGVSSSAALEVAVMTAVASAWGIVLRMPELATACQWVENHVVGAPCGIMDQLTSVCGRTGQLLRLRCQPDVVEGYAPVPAGWRFYGIDSGVRHAVTGSDYRTVRTAAFMGYRILADVSGLHAHMDEGSAVVDDPRWRGYLTNIPPLQFADELAEHLPERMHGAAFLERYGGITDAATRVEPDREYPVRQAARHPVEEQARAERFVELLAALPEEPEAASELGRLMRGSHASYSACGLGSDGTDRLVAMVEEAGPARGLFGARITGGGSGGTVAVLGRADAGLVVLGIVDRYAAESGRRVAVFAESGPGAAQTGVLLVER
jgi:galactokinase